MFLTAFVKTFRNVFLLLFLNNPTSYIRWHINSGTYMLCIEQLDSFKNGLIPAVKGGCANIA